MQTIQNFICLYSQHLQCDVERPFYAAETGLPVLKHIEDLTYDDAQEIGYDNAGSFHNAVKEYRNKIGTMSPESFMYLITQGYDLFGMIEAGLATRKS